jgi:hypothetical protein
MPFGREDRWEYSEACLAQNGSVLPLGGIHLRRSRTKTKADGDHTRTVYIPEKAPKPREQLNLSIEWDGRPKPKHIQEYRQWICWALGVAKNRTELWHFKPLLQRWNSLRADRAGGRKHRCESNCDVLSQLRLAGLDSPWLRCGRSAPSRPMSCPNR